jgi:hypothetical protein
MKNYPMKQTTLPLASLGLAAAAEWEQYCLELDAKIVTNEGLSLRSVTEMRENNPFAWRYFMDRAETENRSPSWCLRKLKRQVEIDRLARLAFGRECWAKGITMAEGDILRGQWPATRSEGLLSRWGRGMMDFCNRLTGVAVMVIAAIFAFGWIVHHGLMGVNP